MSDDLDSLKYSYYAPLTEGGPYQTKLDEYFSTAAQVLITANQVFDPYYDVATVAYPGISSLGGDIAGTIGNTIGFYIDNFSNIEQNIGTTLNKMNDPNFWVTPQPED